MTNWNTNIIDEYRANAGQLGGRLAGRPHLLLHHQGAKSGQERINPVAYAQDGDRYVIIASKGGAPNNPDWYYNLIAHPDVTVEIGNTTYQAHATPVTDEAERQRLYAKMVAVNDYFAEYPKKTNRKIPVFVLDVKK